MVRPLVGICAAMERARFGPWNEVAALVPRSYPDAVQSAGGVAVLIPPDRLGAEVAAQLLGSLDALVVAGGSDIDAGSYGAGPHPEITNTNPDRDSFEIALAKLALERDLPVLGICRGMQVLNLAAGGTLEQHLPERLGADTHRPPQLGSWAEHEVRLQPGTLAARSAGAERLRVKSHHHQGVDDLGAGITVSGWSSEDDTVEAIEVAEREFALGVLWHPEEDPTDRLIPALVEAARN